MIAETNLFGVFFSGVLTAAFVAFLMLFVLRRVLQRVGFYRLVWHPHLVDLALFTILWALAAKAMPVLTGAIGSLR